jgi:protein PET117
MSRASKITLAATSAFAVTTIVFVHFQQKAEKAVRTTYEWLGKAVARSANGWLQLMHEGVIRDMEQQRIKRERQADFDMQRELEAEYRQSQKVHDAMRDMDAKGADIAGGKAI